MEPFRIKMVEPLPSLDRSQRAKALRAADYNLFRLESDQVIIDLFTDSGTSAMSAEQWAALMRGDEAYAGAVSFRRFEQVLRELTGHPYVLPTHQGRAAERILFSSLLRPGQISVSNTHFDTTRANVELAGGRAVDLPYTEGDFQGDLDVAALKDLLNRSCGQVACVVVTVTNNAGGGQPVSMANLKAVRSVCTEAGVPLFLDAARFAENAYLIIQREPGYAAYSPREVAEKMFALADGCVASLKKDGIANMGGALTLRDDVLAARCKELLIATEGFPTYGGLAGRDLEALAQGLLEVTDPAYLAHRAETASWFARQLEKAGLPCVQPAGCHAVYVDARRLLPHIPPEQFPAHALACELYLEAGVRTFEVGTLSFGRVADDGAELPADKELLRLALPRRVYTRSHLAYVAAAAGIVASRAERVPGYRIVEAPKALRHFTARLAPIERRKESE
ncbi:tryptophanase [Microtetraspora malaysiensis]|uniref:Tryptophanase n=1 Tax=Microtetraspora malaysiensis TaxID=161358 RepID=A0ABW6T1Y7_9ACTN